MPNLKYADFNARMLAHNVDLIILLPFFYLIGWIIKDNISLVSLCWCFYTLYHICFELSQWHGTPGKKFQKLLVTNFDGNPASFRQIIYRNMAKIVSILILFAGVIMIALDTKRRGLHDRMAKTVVIFYGK
jgi:uncharacterized RDD family membrane protein YckC